MLFQVTSTKEIFCAKQYHIHNPICIVDLCEVDESIPQFTKRVGLTEYCNIFTICEPIQLQQLTKQHYHRLKDSIHCVADHPSIGYIQLLEDGKVKVFIQTTNGKYYHFDILWDNKYKDVFTTSDLFKKFLKIVEEETE